MAPVGNRNHLHCVHCDGYYFPEETGDGVCPLGEPASISCPVCRDQRLQIALIDGERVCYCDRCRGFLTKLNNFGLIVGKRRARTALARRAKMGRAGGRGAEGAERRSLAAGGGWGGAEAGGWRVGVGAGGEERGKERVVVRGVCFHLEGNRGNNTG